MFVNTLIIDPGCIISWNTERDRAGQCWNGKQNENDFYWNSSVQTVLFQSFFNLATSFFIAFHSAYTEIPIVHDSKLIVIR